MEIVLSVCLLIVPVVSIVSLCLCLVSMRKVKALRELTLRLVRSQGRKDKDDTEKALDAFMVSEI